MYGGALFQVAHALGFLSAHQVALTGMRAPDFTCRGNFEALGGPTMGLQLALFTFSLLGHVRKTFLMSSATLSGLRLRGRLRRRLCGDTLLGREQGHQNVGFHARTELKLRVIGNFF